MRLKCTSCGGSIRLEGVESSDAQSTTHFDSESIEVDVDLDDLEILDAPHAISIPPPPRPPPLPFARPLLPPIPRSSSAPPPWPEDRAFAIPLVRRAVRSPKK